MYICDSCGDIRNELKEEYIECGNFQDGNNGFCDTISECDCGGTYVEAVKCEQCGDWAAELHNGVCEDCLAEEATVANAELFGEINKEKIKVNGFYVKVFGEAQINSILHSKFLELTTEAERRTKATEFCLEDKEEFGEFIKEWI